MSIIDGIHISCPSVQTHDFHFLIHIKLSLPVTPQPAWYQAMSMRGMSLAKHSTSNAIGIFPITKSNAVHCNGKIGEAVSYFQLRRTDDPQELAEAALPGLVWRHNPKTDQLEIRMPSAAELPPTTDVSGRRGLLLIAKVAPACLPRPASTYPKQETGIRIAS